MSRTRLSNWGRFPVVETELIDLYDENRAREVVLGSGSLIARGLGRCYGDSSLGEKVISTLPYKRFLTFDPETGALTCEAGVSFAEILEVFVPKGWFLPVTPGTKFITVGGAIASDVHGKNHHKEGSFGNHVSRMKILLASGEVVVCTPETHSDLFFATIGGMGLTGIILEAGFRLKKIETSFISQKIKPAENLEQVMAFFEQSKNFTYSVAWIDCLARGASLGKSILYLGEHAAQEEIADTPFGDKPLFYHGKGLLGVPFDFPSGSLNSLTVRMFNGMYYSMNKMKSDGPVHLDPFFYPLDAIGNWNRIYGKKGFLQYQFVLPLEKSHTGMTEVLQAIAKEGRGSFLAVLKLFGKQDSLISFPIEGYTLALDFPIMPGLMKFLNKLDEIVLKYEGRFYFTKDSRLKPENFRPGYPRLDEFLAIKRKYDPENIFSSTQSKRLGLT
ncbi:MAG: FAD-linked oxidase [Ignavibacteriaceae bacterium]|nr:MAG: FAD-binding oxidoreductase [Chlorobiota bacterium]GJQ31985.1 MAG: FAD-linked oxidase [Ignavibacteriaceae bacterium]